MEIVWTFIGNRMDFGFHNNCIFPWYGYSMEVVWIYYGFCGAIANFVVWISLFFPDSVLHPGRHANLFGQVMLLVDYYEKDSDW